MMKNNKRFFGDANPEYKWAAKQWNDKWFLFTHKPTWHNKEKFWFDYKDPGNQCFFVPIYKYSVEPENSLIKRYNDFKCC